VVGSILNGTAPLSIKYFHANSALADSTATGTNSVAIGPVSTAGATNAVSIGNNATASANAGDVALGANSTTAAVVPTTTVTVGGVTTAVAGTTPSSTVSVGAPGQERTITNVAAGRVSATSTDAINGSELNATNTQVTNLATTVNNLTTGKTGPFVSDNTAAAANPIASGTDASAGGFGASATGSKSTVVGNAATDNGNANATVLGNGASIAAGVAGSNVAVGQGSTVTTAAVPVPGATIGGTAYTFAGTTPGGVFSVGTAASPRQVTNVAAGQLSATSLDAVNGSQLFATNTEVNTLASAIAGGTGIKYFHANSALADSTPTGTNSVAIGPVSTAGSNDAVSIGHGATASANAGDVALGSNATTAAVVPTTTITVAGTTTAVAGTTPGSTVSVGAPGQERTITNVAAGRVSATSTDAVNGSELNATNTAVNTVNTNVNNLTTTVNNLTTGKTGPFVSDNTAAAANPIASGANASAGGFGASATGAKSTVVGNSATDNGNANATVLGNGASIAAGVAGSNVAVGQGSTVTTAAVPVTNTTIGTGASAVTTPNFAGTTPSGVFSVGTAGSPRQVTNVAAGQLSATSLDAVNGSQLFQTNQVVGSILNGTAPLSIKYFHANSTLADSTATGTNSVAIGPVSTAGANNGVSIGNGATASANAGDVALGSGSTTAAVVPTTTVTIGGVTTAVAGTTPGSTVSVGAPGQERTITNVAAGRVSATSTDAINGSELNATNTAVNTVTTNVNNLTNTVNNLTTGKSGPFVSDNTAAAANPIASGADASAGGFGASATGSKSTVVGNSATDNGNANATVLGNGASITAGLGGSNVAIGQGSTVTAAAVPTTTGTVAGNTYTYAGGAPGGVVSFGTAASPRQLANVAAGQVTATSLDAVNGSQLFATNQQVGFTTQGVTGLTTALGGGASFNSATGAFTAPSYTIAGNTYNNVGSALNALTGGSTTAGIKYFHANSTKPDSSATGTDSIAVGPNALATAQDSMAMGLGAGASTTNSIALGNGATAGANIGDVALGSSATTATVVPTSSVTIAGTTYAVAGTTPTSTVSVGAVGAERTITNVAAGRVTATSTDAVNGSELFAVEQAVNKIATSTATSGPVQYSNTATPTTPNGGTPTQDVTLVGATPGSPVALHNLANGSTAAGSTDAINGGQLNTGLGSVATALGGGSTYNPATGQITSPSYTIGGNTYNNVGAALTALTGTGTTAGIKYFHANSTGPDSSAIGTDSVAIGTGATANNKNDVALGANSSTSAAVGTSTVKVNGTTYNVAGTTPVGTVSVGSAGNERTITNVAAGQVNATSTDAINGSELFATNQAVAKLSTGAAGPVQYSNAATPTTPNGGTPTNNVTLVGANPNQPVVISNVAAGVNPTDAVNLSQLQSNSGQTLTQANTYTNQVAAATLNAANQYTNTVANQLQSEIGGLQGQINRANSGVAMAMAMGGGFLPENKRFAIAANYGAFSGQGAMAFTGLVRVTDNIVLNGSLGYSPEQNSYGGRVGGQIAW
jgi:autotransporter adhesin